MTAGHMAIYRESTGGEDRDSASYADVEFDTTVREDSTFTLSSSKNVNLGSTGKYLCMFNETIDIDAGLRYSAQANLKYNGTDVEVRGSGYARNTQGCTQAYVYGAGIIQIDTANQDLVLEIAKASTDPTTNNAARRASSSGLQILKLNDDWDYFRASGADASLVQNIGDTVVWKTVEEEDSGSFALQVNEEDIECEQGWYIACYSITFTSTASPPTRVGAVAWLELDGAEIIGSRSFKYARQTNGCGTQILSGICLFEADSSNPFLSLNTTTSNRFGSAVINDEQTYIQVVKLEGADTSTPINKVWVYDSAGSQDLSQASLTDFNWASELEDDSDFAHSTASSTDEITVQTDGDYLFLFGMYAQNTSQTVEYRYNTYVRFSIDGTAQYYGNSGTYFRGYVSATQNITNCGCSHGILMPDMAASEVVTLGRIRESSETTGPPVTVANKSALTGIYLPSIFPAVEESVAGSYWYAQQGF
ncbi:MAG: hypothetical protein ABIK92_21775 [Pseudomonadota bacterium]